MGEVRWRWRLHRLRGQALVGVCWARGWVCVYLWPVALEGRRTAVRERF